MTVMNFGMGVRPVSQVVQTEDERYAAMQQQLQSLAQRRIGVQADADGALNNYGQARVAQARAQGFNVGDDYAQLTASVAGRPENGVNYILNPYNFSADIGDAARQAGLSLNPAQNELASIDKGLMSGENVYQQERSGRQAAQGAQQSSYNADTLAGGQQGGVLSGIAQQGTLDPTQMASWGTPWTQPGFGNPGSLGGLGGYGGKTSQPQQNGGWGGVFGNRNPWSAA